MSRTAALFLALALAACSKTETATNTPVGDAGPSGPSGPSGALPTMTSSAPPAAAASSSPACNVVTPDDLKRATGIDFKPGEVTSDQASMARCAFSRAQGSEGGVTITVHSSDASAMYSSMPGMKTVTGNGIGDKAWWSDQVSTFAAVKGAKTLVIGFNYQDPKNRDAAVEIAKVAMAKL